MDKSWMDLPDRFGTRYIEGIEGFIVLASNHTDITSRICCPCRICNNRYYKQVDEVKDHLLDNGMDKYYTRWVHHAEEYEVLSDDDDDDDASADEGVVFYGVCDLLQDLGECIYMDNPVPDMQYGDADNFTTREAEAFSGLDRREGNATQFGKLVNESWQPLYPGYKNFSKLDYLMKLSHVKVINHWSNKSFDMILQLIKAVLPEGEMLPKSYHEAKTLMRELGLGYIAIHACKYDCELFWGKEYENLQSCPVCGEWRYKVVEGKFKKIPQKVLRYFPIKPRLQRLFMSRMTAVDMRWHKEKQVREENVFRHPADSKVWEDFDKENEWFSNEPRNIRLGLASDGFNPFGDMSTIYSMWPVMLMLYNLPPWKCMKDPFIFMSLLIPGPKSPGNDIDVYLWLLIDELKCLWENGMETYDVVTKRTFQLHAALLWTIYDFPAFANLSGWSTKAKTACPSCSKDTVSLYLKNSHKLCYMGNRRFLQPQHSWRSRGKNLFDGMVENRPKPKDLSREDVVSQLELVEERNFGKNPNNKKRKRTQIELNWSKKSIFFELPYWRTLKLCHNLDVMHIEKNICESILGTMMGIDGKTKDSMQARLDLAALGITSNS